MLPSSVVFTVDSLPFNPSFNDLCIFNNFCDCANLCTFVLILVMLVNMFVFDIIKLVNICNVLYT